MKTIFHFIINSSLVWVTFWLCENFWMAPFDYIFSFIIGFCWALFLMYFYGKLTTPKKDPANSSDNSDNLH